MELWDAYDENKNFLGYKIEREKFYSYKTEYHIIVHIWIKNSKNEFLIQQRSANKTNPLKWAWTGGSVLAGETSLDGAIREVREELGLNLDKEKMTLFTSFKRSVYRDFVYVYLYECDVDVSNLVLQKEEVNAAAWFTKQKIHQMISSGEFVNIDNSQYVLELL